MKLKYSLIVVAISATLAGCNPDNTPTPTVADNKPVKEHLQDAAASTKAAVVQGKDEFMAAMDTKMKELDAKIDALKAKSADYKDDAKVQADKALDSLHEQRSALGKKYDELKASTQDAWDKTKAAFSAAWDDMQKAYDDAKDKFK